MRRAGRIRNGLGFAGLAVLAGCAGTGQSRGDLPLAVGNGSGSQYGNYAARLEGETRGPSGERCVVYDWDRPLTRDLAIRLRSASCDSPETPGHMMPRELSRTVIPLSQSTLSQSAPTDLAAPD